MVFKTKDGRPPCANPDCKSGYGGITQLNGKFYCGNCIVIAMRAKQNHDEAIIREAFKNGKNN